MKWSLLPAFIFCIATLNSCCASDDCAGNELYLVIQFEDINGNNLLSQGSLSIDSIEVIYKYETSQKISALDYINDEFQVFINLESNSSIQLNVGQSYSKTFDFVLTEFSEKGCCPSHKNFGTTSDGIEICTSCLNNPISIVL